MLNFSSACKFFQPLFIKKKTLLHNEPFIIHFLIVGEKEGLQQKVETLQREEETCCELQQMIQKLETQLSDTRLRLDKEKAKYQSAFRQQEVSFADKTQLFITQINRFKYLWAKCCVAVNLVNAGQAEVLIKESRCS